MFTKRVYLKPRTTLIAHSNVKDYLSCSGMTPTVVENNLQRAIEKENEIDQVIRHPWVSIVIGVGLLRNYEIVHGSQIETTSTLCIRTYTESKCIT